MSQHGERYVFGPYQLILPSGWSAVAEDGIHELLPHDDAFAVHISGYEKDTPVTDADIVEFADENDADATESLALTSGLEGRYFDLEDDGDVFRYWVIRDANNMIVITLTTQPQAFAEATVSATAVVETICATASA